MKPQYEIMGQTMNFNYGQTEPFKKDLKRLLKKYRSLESDLEVAKRDAIELFHAGKPDANGIWQKMDTGSIFPIPGFCDGTVQICKIKKFACKALKGRGRKSGIRVIYAFYPATLKIDFIEIYFKGENEIEDQARIKDYLQSI